MFKLEPLSEKTRKEYIRKIRTNLVRRITKGRTIKKKHIGLSKSVISLLIPNWNSSSPDYSIIDALLTAEPEELYTLNDDLWSKIKKHTKSEDKLRKRLKLIFNYDGVFSQNKKNSYWLAKLIEKNTCCYCNRQYCFTVERSDSLTDKARIVRPSFDHWFLKSDYPLLSLSLHNLIPSCPSCNSSVRGTKKLDLASHINPYVSYIDKPKSETYFRFRASKKGKERFAWQLNIERRPGSLIDETIKTFALDEIYSCHEDLEVRDIMMFDAKYKDKYLATLFKKVIKDARFTLSREEVYRMLFGCELEKDKYLNRPFSKLKHDLLLQIGVLKE